MAPRLALSRGSESRSRSRPGTGTGGGGRSRGDVGADEASGGGGEKLRMNNVVLDVSKIIVKKTKRYQGWDEAKECTETKH